MIQPVMKKYGRSCTSRTAIQAARRSYPSTRVSRNAKNEVPSEHPSAATRTAHSLCPKVAVPSAISHATIGGWSR